MKNIIKFIISIPLWFCILIVFLSCEDELDIEEKGTISYDKFYQTDEDAISATTAMYNKFTENITRCESEEFIFCPYVAVFNLTSDDLFAGGANPTDHPQNVEFNEFKFGPSSQFVKNLYYSLYRIIYGANLVIDNFPNPDSPIKQRCVAEAKVIRAFAHFTLVAAWGNPPRVDHVLDLDAKLANSDGKETLQWCADECLQSIEYLDERKDLTDKDATAKVTRGFAYFVAAKALLFKGDYVGAKEAARKIIESKKYDLVPGERIRETFHTNGEGNEEVIFAGNVQPDATIGVSDPSILYKTLMMHLQLQGWMQLVDYPKGIYTGGWGGYGVTQDFGDALTANDGSNSFRRQAWIKKFEDDVLYGMSYNSDTVWLNDDKTQYRLLTQQEKEEDNLRGIKVNGIYGASEYLNYKILPDPVDYVYDVRTPYKNLLIARYAEVLLIYAEACSQVGDPDGLGLECLNKIQIRAGSNHISESLTLDEVKNEKRFEMFMEGCRYSDLVRWGETDKLANNGKNVTMLFDAMFDANGQIPGAGNVESKHRIYTELMHYNDDVECGFKKGKHELLPYPISEISMNPNICQNSGY